MFCFKSSKLKYLPECVNIKPRCFIFQVLFWCFFVYYSWTCMIMFIRSCPRRLFQIGSSVNQSVSKSHNTIFTNLWNVCEWRHVSLWCVVWLSLRSCFIMDKVNIDQTSLPFWKKALMGLVGMGIDVFIESFSHICCVFADVFELKSSLQSWMTSLLSEKERGV